MKNNSTLICAFLSALFVVFSFSKTKATPLSDSIHVVSNVFCNGDSTGSATVYAYGGTAPYTYLWNPGGSTNATATGLSAGTYTVTVIDALSDTVKTTVKIKQPPKIKVRRSWVKSTNCITPNGSATVAVSGGIAPYTYLWNPTGQTTDSATGLGGGITYTCTVTDNLGCTAVTTADVSSSDGLFITLYSTPDTVGAMSCDGAAWVVPTGGVGAYTYLWSPGGQTVSSLTGLCTGTYCCKVTDSGGCSDSSCIAVVSLCPTFSPNICYVTSDSASLHNIIVWQKTGIDSNVVDSFIVYRGVTSFSYAKIGQVSIHGFSQYIDTASYVDVTSYFYEIGMVGTCQSAPPLSAYHQSILLQSSLGIGNTVNLSWNFYQGVAVNYYRIMRDDSGLGQWHVLDSVPGTINAYTDTAAPLNPNLRYRLSLNWNVACSPYIPAESPRKKIRLGSFLTKDEGYSNILTSHFTGISQTGSLSSRVDVYPNPATTILNVNISGIKGEADFYLTDVLGRNVYSDSQKIVSPGFKETINMQSLQPGVYFLIIETNGQRLVKKVTKL